MSKLITKKDIDLSKVIEFAQEKHKGQKRDDGSDYITHPLRVAQIVDKYKGKDSSNRKILFAAAVLHDTIEDTYTSYRELSENFGEIVASLVLELSTSKYACNYKGKAQYLAEKMEHMTSYALTIKLADRLDNVSSLEGCAKDKIQRTLSDTTYILNYLEEHRALTKPQILLANQIRKTVEEFRTTHTEMFCHQK